MRRLHQLHALISETLSTWRKQKPHLIGAALAFYIMFSMGPILVLSIRFIDLLLGQYITESQILQQIQVTAGPQIRDAIAMILSRASGTPQGTVAALVSLPLALFGATMFFFQLLNALNHVWDIPDRRLTGFKGFLKDYLFAFIMLLIAGGLLLVMVVKTSIIGLMLTYVPGSIPVPGIVVRTLDVTISFTVITVLFAIIYKIFPDIKIHFRDCLIGGGVTSALFMIGQHLIGLYLSTSRIASAYGAAGSVTVLLIWVYYTAQIILIGAVFTKIYSLQFGSLER